MSFLRNVRLKSNFIGVLRRRERELEIRNAELTEQLESEKRKVIELQNELHQAHIFQAAVDQSSESIFFTDIKGRILYVNRSFEQTSGYSREDVIGKTPRVLKSGKQSLEVYKNLWGTLLRGEIYRDILINRRKDGTLYQEDANIAPVRDKDGKIVNFISVKVNITPLLEGQRVLEGINAELSRSNDELEQFAYIASHDLQEPLRSVSSCLQLLKKRYQSQLDQRADELIARAVAACQRMSILIDDLLTLSTVNAGTTELTETDTAAVFQQVCANLSLSIEESNAEITYENLPKIISTPSVFAQILQNLIGNAIKFRGNRPPFVKVEAKRDGDHWVFSVADQGIGIEPQHLERIFRLFQCLHSRAEYAGTGLGLAICKKIVERHHGQIWVESQPDQGSTFFFTLPVDPPRSIN